MGLFQYKAVDEKGKELEGVIEAGSILEAKDVLGKRPILLTDVSEHKFQRRTLRLQTKTVMLFTQELSNLLTAGMPLYGALNALKDKYEKDKKLYSLILDLSDQIKRGVDFSVALSQYSEVFDLIYCSMIKNAEKTGTLASALEELTKIMKRSLSLKKKVVSALLYPSLLAVFCFVVIFSLIFFVIPSLFDLFDGKNLHPITSIVLGISKIAVMFKKEIIAFLFMAIGSVGFIFYRKRYRDKMKKQLYKIPMIKPLFTKMAIVRFSRAFSLLISTGVSYVEALKLAKEVMENPLLEEDISFAEKRALEGDKLSTSLKAKGNFPVLVIRMLEIAEESAKTSEMMGHIAHIYEDELEQNLLKLTTFLQPILLLFLGAVIGFVVLAVLLPLTDVSSFTG